MSIHSGIVSLAVAGTGLRHLVVPVGGTADQVALELDAARVAALAWATGVDTICVCEPGASDELDELRHQVSL